MLACMFVSPVKISLPVVLTNVSTAGVVVTLIKSEPVNWPDNIGIAAEDSGTPSSSSEKVINVATVEPSTEIHQLT